jgi:predicted NAD/FAD-binding protein
MPKILAFLHYFCDDFINPTVPAVTNVPKLTFRQFPALSIIDRNTHPYIFFTVQSDQAVIKYSVMKAAKAAAVISIKKGEPI